jgi:hypothetical protein
MTSAQHKPADRPQDRTAKQRRQPNQNHAWARRQIRRAIEALHRRGVPLAELNRTQQMSRCEQWMLKEDGKIKLEIPGTRSFERHLPEIVAEVLAGGS